MTIRSRIESPQYYYGNGLFIENPTIFLFIPEGFSPIESSLQITNINNTPNLQFVKNITENGNNFKWLWKRR